MTASMMGKKESFGVPHLSAFTVRGLQKGSWQLPSLVSTHFFLPCPISSFLKILCGSSNVCRRSLTASGWNNQMERLLSWCLIWELHKCPFSPQTACQQQQSVTPFLCLKRSHRYWEHWRTCSCNI